MRQDWGAINSWTTDQLKNASHLLEALGRQELEQLNGSQLANALANIKNIRLDRAKVGLHVDDLMNYSYTAY